MAFHEEGIATLTPNDEQLTAHSRLLWDFSSDVAHVLFDEQSWQDQKSARIAGARHFHSITFPAAMFSEHPCGPDVYRGRIVFESQDAFRLEWRVSGPRKLGVIISRFRRKAAPLTNANSSEEAQ